MRSIIAIHVAGLLVVNLLTGCIDSDKDSSTSSGNIGIVAEPVGEVLITAAGVKGPLAFADANIYAFDSSFPDYYDKNSPLSSSISSQYAEIDGLSVPRGTQPPYILTVGGANAVDLNTGTTPVISTLTTVITNDMLTGNQPIYATPLTTLVFHMARHGAGASTDANTFIQQVRDASSQVSRTFSISQDIDIDVIKSPLVINDGTVTVSQQEEAVYHRAALEAFAAKVYALSLSKGDGLHATYYNDSTLTSAALERIDSTVNFDWQKSSPDTMVNSDYFSVRWTGLIEPNYSENYTFYTSTDDGVRLWVDGQLIIDHWSDQVEKEYSATIHLTKGEKHPITMEYYDNTGFAAAKLLWSSAGQPKSVVPKANLYSVSNPALIHNITTDTIIERLALDLQSDGIIDNAANGTMIGGIDPVILSQDPMELYIPNTAYRIEDTIKVMADERSSMGAENGPDLLIDTVNFSNQFISANSSDFTSPAPVQEPDLVTTVVPAPAPIVTLSVNSIEFGDLAVGGISDASILILTNDGNAPLTISTITLSDGFVETNNCDNYLPAGESCSININFVPTVSGTNAGSLIIYGNALDGFHSVSLRGNSTVDSDSRPGATQPVIPPFIAPNAPEYVFYHDFNNEAIHTYSSDDLKMTWDATTELAANDSMKIVQDPDSSGSHGHVMQAFYAANTIHNNNSSGFSWRTKIGSHDEMYFAYDVYFEDDAEFTRGGKLPGLGIPDYFSAAGVKPDGTDRWTGSLIWATNGAIANYVYHANQYEQYGDHLWWNDGPDGQVYFQKGKWNRVEIYYKMNTPGVLDGRLKGWLNGKLALDTSGIMYRMPGGEHLTIGSISMISMYGGGDTSAPSMDQHIYFDNIVASTQPITH